MAITCGLWQARAMNSIGLSSLSGAIAVFLLAVGHADAQTTIVACDPNAPAKAQVIIDACNSALAGSTSPGQRAHLLFTRAYARDATEQYESALPDLDEAIRLQPDYAAAYHERAYARSSLGRYADAISDIDAQLRLQPNSPEAYQERAYSDRALARFEDAYSDWSQLLALKPKDAGALIARGGAALWLGRFDQAKADFALGAELAKAQEDRANQDQARNWQETMALWLAVSPGPSPEENCEAAQKKGDFGRPQLIGDCTAAFLKAATPASKADALTTRYMAHIIGRQNPREAVADAQAAAAIDPENPDRHINLGFVYIENRHSWAGIREFDRAIALKPSYPAYAGRASAKLNRGDFDGAFADAKTAFEMKPNILALDVLGNIAMDKLHDPKAAKLYWMGAYQLGDRGDDLMARLKSVGVSDPAHEKAD